MKVHCEWESSAITLDLDGDKCILLADPEEKDRWLRGVVCQGHIMLTPEQAALLMSNLKRALKEYNRLSECAKELADK